VDLLLTQTQVAISKPAVPRSLPTFLQPHLVAFVHGSLFPFKLRLERIYGSLYLEAVRKGLGRGLMRQNPQRGNMVK